MYFIFPRELHAEFSPLLKLQMNLPGKNHEEAGNNQVKNNENSF